MNRQTAINCGFLAGLLVLTGVSILQINETASLRRSLEAIRPVTTAGGPRMQVPLPPSETRNAVTARKATGAEDAADDAPSPSSSPPLAARSGVLNLKNQNKSKIRAAVEQGAADAGPLTFQAGDAEMQGVIGAHQMDTPAGLRKGPGWNHAQATGAPDTEGSGDLPTAWAPRSPRSGEQWLQVGYDKAVEIGSINVHETYNPGAISRVTAIMPDGSEREIWKGTAPAGDTAAETTVPVPPGITSDKIRLYVDTDRVQSWPEIDAVELVGKDGSKQWATSSSASSSYGENRPGAGRF